MTPRQRLRGLCAGLLAVAACAAHAGGAPAAPQRPPAEHFFDNQGFSGALLSPDARRLAVRVGAPGRRDLLAVIDLETMASKVVATFSDADVDDFDWVNNQRLIFDTGDKRLAQGETEYAPGLYAVDSDGRRFEELASRTWLAGTNQSGRAILPWHTFMMRQHGAQDSDWVYVSSREYNGKGTLEYVGLRRLNTVTGRSERVETPALHTQFWMLDHQGQPRFAAAANGNIESYWYRDPATSAWRKLVEFDGYKGGQGAFTPIAFGPDGTLYVTTDASGKEEVHEFDFAANRVAPKALIKVDNFDFRGSLVTTRDKLLGVRMLSDARSNEWFNADMKAIQQRINAKLPDNVNLVSVAARAETPWVLVESYSDIQPRLTLLFNSATGELKKIGASHARIDPAQMGRKELVRYKARDGLTIPAWLTLPHGSDRKNLPLVVLVHGGPYVRGGEWSFDPQAQFLASRGYAVLEPEYRGSTGFGVKHYKAGWKQWGLKMQDDIADGAKWAIAEGIVDPQRICIAGASYGGYATLMGLVNDPGLYKCGVNWLGVTDIGLMANGHWRFDDDMTDTYKRYGMPDLVGDPVKDAAQFTATSPIAQAARIKQPLLMAYGGADRRVPVIHGRKFYDAVKAGNPNVELVEYDEEGHGWYLPKTRIDFWTRVEKFLDQNIGKR